MIKKVLKWLLLFLSVFMAAMLKTAFPRLFYSLPFVLLVGICLLTKENISPILGLFAGILSDSFSLVPYHTLVYTLASVVAMTLHKKLYRVTPFVAVCSVLSALLLSLIWRGVLR